MIEPSLCEGLQMLMRHEGFRPRAYDDATGETVKAPEGRLTIGYGRNLADVGLRECEALFLLQKDIDFIYQGLYNRYSWFSFLNTPRQWVCINMAYQMGLEGFASFKKMIGNLEVAVNDKKFHNRWVAVQNEMIDSQWAENHKDRAYELGNAMIRGAW